MDGVNWVAIVSATAVGVFGWFFNQLLASVKTNLTQEIARVDAAAKVNADQLKLEISEHADTKKLAHRLEVEMGRMASQESVREMERDLSKLFREEMAGVRQDIAGLRSEISNRAGE